MASINKPLFSWLTERSSGLLLHPTSLPGSGGVGTLGSSAKELIDFLVRSGMSYWQVCPLGPTGFGDSPYQSFSAFAGNPYLIDLDSLVGFELLQSDELLELQSLPNSRVDFGGIYVKKWPLLRLAFKRFQSGKRAYLPNYGHFKDFKKEHKDWLDPFALFMALKGEFNGAPWYRWEAKYRTYEKASGTPLLQKLEEQVESHRFYQYLFWGQWNEIKRYANDNGVSIIGDIPIFVSPDSADIWSETEIFKVDKSGRQSACAGVPPDYFCEEGQFWGNPVFDWKALKVQRYDWWIRRLKANFLLYDVVRLDHFRGFQDYWSIPAKYTDARKGKWVRGPGLDFFKCIKQALPDAKIIAEDLGEITPDVRQLLENSGLPGMLVLQFAFDGSGGNLYLPHNHTRNSVVYPGTHDNDTVRGWYDSLGAAFQDQVRRYYRVSGEDISWDFVRSAFSSPSNLAIIPMQDLLSLGSDARFNSPGIPENNWGWRMLEQQFHDIAANGPDYLKELGGLYGRLRAKKKESS